MYRYSFVLLLVVSLFTIVAANIAITQIGATQTEIAIGYTATTTAPCTLTATDQSTQPIPVADLDATKQTNANQDISRTYANGFISPSVCGTTFCSGGNTDVHRIAVIGEHDKYIKYPIGCTAMTGGSNGCKYVGAGLRAATSYAITVSCNAGADTGTATFSTANLPMGSYYPEYPLSMPGFGLNGMGYPQPTIDRSVNSPTVIDPLHGVALQQIMPMNAAYGDQTSGVYNFAMVIPVGAGWTSPNNFNTRQAPATLATTSTANSVLFAAFPLGKQDVGFDEVISDFTIVPYGSSTNHTEIAEFCISLDSGQTCANYTPIDVTFSNAATGCQPSGNCTTDTIPTAGTFGNSFSTWGGLFQSGQEDLTNLTFTGVNVSGSTVTVTPNVTSDPPVKFPLYLAPGSKFDLTGCSTGTITNKDANGHLTVSSVNGYGQITTSETGNTATGCTFSDYHAGVRVILKNSGTLNLSLNMTNYQAHSGQNASDPERWYCNPNGKVTDIVTNCDGTTNTTPQSGYLCQFPQQFIYLFQDNGQVCKQSNLVDVAGGRSFPSSNFVSWYSPNQWLGTTFSSQTVLATHIANNYTAMPYGDINQDTRTDRFTYTTFSGATSIHNAIQAQGGLTATIENFFGGVGLSAIIDNGTSGAYIQYGAFSGSQNSPCLLAWSDAATNTLIRTANLLGDYPNRYGGCHFGPQGSAGNSIFNNLGNGNPAFWDTTVKLGGPFQAWSIATYKNGVPTKHNLAISAATAASPAVLTSANNDLATQPNAKSANMITCSGATDTRWNGVFYFRRVDNNTFQLYLDDSATTPLNSTSFGAIGVSYICTTAAPIYTLVVSGVVDNGSGNARLNLNLADAGFLSVFASGINPASDSDPICLTNGQTCSNDTTQYYLKKSCAGCTSSQVDVYKNAALTIPATLTEINNIAPNKAAYAETCPDQSSITLPGPLYTDTGWGSGVNARVGCVTVEVQGHFCSSTPATGEAATFPCPENASKSMVHDFLVGDGLYDVRSATTINHETGFLIKAVAGPDPNSYNLTYLRTYGNINGSAAGGGGFGNVYGVEHPYGFGLMGTSIINQSMGINITSGAYGVAGSTACGCHCEAMVPSITPGNITTAYAWESGCNGGNPDYVNATLSQWAIAPGTLPVQNITPAWANGLGSVTPTTNSYPAHRQVYPIANAQDMNWKADQFLNVQAFGNGQNVEDDGIGLTRTLTHVSGNIWQIGVAGSLVGGSVNLKVTPMLVHDLPFWYFQDKSGPSSVLSDPADMGKSCTAYLANECVTGSVPGNVYAVFNRMYDPGSCMANSGTNGGACAEPFYSTAGWFSQFIQSPPSANNEGVRPLTKMFWEAPGHYEFYSMTPSLDGKYNLTVPMPIFYNPRHNIYSGSSWWRIINPPFQKWDSTNRQGFVKTPVQYAGGAGVTVRTSWGYGEYGDPNNGQCSQYNSQCFTTNAATSANPFDYSAESVAGHKLTCTSGCTDQVPLIPGRVAYLRTYTTVGGVETAGPVQVVAVP